MARSPQDLPPQAQEMIGELQEQQQQLQQIAEQKNQIEAQKKQIEMAFDALDDAGDDAEVFRVVGPVGIKSDREEVEEELTDMKETMDVRLDSMERKEDNIREGA